VSGYLGHNVFTANINRKYQKSNAFISLQLLQTVASYYRQSAMH